jgi:hypothetical protein
MEGPHDHPHRYHHFVHRDTSEASALNPERKPAIATGVVFFITHVTAIAAIVLHQPAGVVGHPKVLLEAAMSSSRSGFPSALRGVFPDRWNRADIAKRRVPLCRGHEREEPLGQVW